jgi:hypothetical protein
MSLTSSNHRPRLLHLIRVVTAVTLSVAALTAVRTAAAAGTNSVTAHAVGDRDAATGAPLPLAGATLRAYTDSSLTTAVGECTTGADGACSIAGLDAGTYWVASVGAPPGGVYSSIDRVTTSIDGEVPYAKAVTVGEADAETRPFVFRRADPTMPEQCGARVALVYDLSSSVSPDEAAVMKQNSKAFVDALAGTASSIAIHSFATTAPAVANTDHDFVEVGTPAGAALVKQAIDALAGASGDDGYTNWDAALRAVPPSADVAVVFTDGNPTVFGVPPVFPPVMTGLDQIEAGVASANTVKARGTRVIAVGIGDVNDISARNLQAISGPVEGSDFAITTFADLGRVFHRLADDLCGGTVIVHKRVIGDASVSGEGWRFTAGPDAVPATAATDASGTATFRVRGFDAATGTKVVTLLEEPTGGFVLDRSAGTNAVCTDGSGSRVPARDVLGGVVVELAATSLVTCEFVNAAIPDAPVSDAPEPVEAAPAFTG